MSATLNGLGHQLFGWLGPLSIELAALALLVLAAGRLIRSPALRHLLWLAVLFKPFIAIAVTSPYTVFAPLAPLAEPGWDASPHGQVEHLASLAPLPPAGTTTAASSAALTSAGWAALLWLVGTSLLTGRILIGCCILRRMRRQASVQREGPLFEALRRARAALDCHPWVEVATSPSIRSPLVLGILKPLIVVPTHVVERLSPGELALVLMHELAHVRRCDNLWLLLQRLVTAALFFHPALWLCGRMLRRESELACDDLVVCATGRPEAYARGLTLVAEGAAHSNSSLRRFPVMSTLVSTESDLSQRIRRTLNGRAPRMGMRARLFAVGLLCPLAVVTMPSYGATDGDPVSMQPLPDVAADSLSIEEVWEVRRHQKGQKLQIDIVEAIERAMEVEDMREAIRRAAGETAELTGKERLRKVVDAVVEYQVLRMAMATDPDEWSDELRARLIALKPDSSIDELAQAVRNARSGGVTTVVYEYKERGTDRPHTRGFLLMVDQDGNMKLEDRPVTLATLKERLKRSLIDSTTIVSIQADKRASHGQIVEIMEVARQAGVGMYQVIATEP